MSLTASICRAAMITAMRGTMIWFNADKGHGFIRTEEDERLIVHSDGFTAGEPVGRCAGNDVSFDRETIDGQARAVNVATAPLPTAPRALRRGSYPSTPPAPPTPR